MTKTIIACLFVVFYLINPAVTNSGYSVELEEISFKAPDLEGTYKLSGSFNKSGIAEPNGTIFKFHYADKKSPLDIFHSNIYIYMGRTGEKTFELQYRPEGIFMTPDNFASIREHPAKINLYFTENDLYPLKIKQAGLCTKDDKVYLKMLKLKGNQLEYQIVLPDCLKKPNSI